MQEPGESIDSYAVSLKEFGARCGFTGEEYSHRIIDQFILGIKDRATQNKLLQEPPKTIDEEVSVARRFEAANAMIQTLTAKTEVLSIANRSADVLQVGGVSNSSNLVSAEVCFKCNGWGHEAWQCPTPSNVNEFKSVKQTVCFHCQKPGHIARNCKLNRHSQLAKAHLWWEGPVWLKGGQSEWPTSLRLEYSPDVAIERRKVVVLIVASMEDQKLFPLEYAGMERVRSEDDEKQFREK